MKDWFVYVLECNDGTFYTGITDNINKRLVVHNSGKGAKYTRGRTPVILKFVQKVSARGEALRREVQIKKMTRNEKKELMMFFGSSLQW